MNLPIRLLTTASFLYASTCPAWAKDGFSTLTDTGNAMSTMFAAASGSTAFTAGVIVLNPTSCVDQQYIYLPATKLANWDLGAQPIGQPATWFRL